MQSFNEQCYELVRQVPAGKVTTYKAIAHALGTGAYRAVGNAMASNPDTFPNKGATPCHRVVKTDGSIGGFAHLPEAKIALLQSEGVKIKNNTVDLTTFAHVFA